MSKTKHSDAYYLQMALAEAKKGRYTTSPNPAVGCVIVRNHEILGVGYHHCAGQPHAEVMALQAANYEVEGATCYVTLEPCSHYGRTPPCAQALIDAKVKKVVIGSTDPNPKVAGKGIKMLLDAHIDVIKATGKLNKECLKLNRAFFKSITTNRPYTILKYGMSLDGKVALSTNESKWITNEAARRDVQRLRLWSDAIITSYKTVQADNPKLNVRLEDVPSKLLEGVDTTLIKQPLKVIVDSRASLLPNRQLSDLERYGLFSMGENYIVVGCNELSESQATGKKKSSKKATTALDPLSLALASACACGSCQASALAPSTCLEANVTAKTAPKSKSSRAPKALATKDATTKSAAAKATLVGNEAQGQDKSKVVSKSTSSVKAKAPAKETKAKAAPKRVTKSAAVKQLANKKAPEVMVSVAPDMVSSWHIDESKVVARGKNFVVEKWSERVFIVAVPFALGSDNKLHASVSAVLDFLGSKDIRVAMVEAGSNLGSAFLENGLIDECYCYMSPMILGLEAKSAFAIHEPKKLVNAVQFKKTKVKTFENNICMILSKPQLSKAKKSS